MRGEGTEHVLAECDGTLVQLGLFSGWIQAQVVTAEEGSAWLERRASSERQDRPMTLAELYARLEGREVGAGLPAGFAD